MSITNLDKALKSKKKQTKKGSKRTKGKFQQNIKPNLDNILNTNKKQDKKIAQQQNKNKNRYFNQNIKNTYEFNASFTTNTNKV